MRSAFLVLLVVSALSCVAYLSGAQWGSAWLAGFAAFLSALALAVFE